ncbi:MAG: GntR family transcriptional regulator [Oscillospiraceae bacterium]
MESRPGSLLDWAYAQIRQMLFSGELKSGEKIVVGQLAEKLAISPTPVKEALNRLVAQGVLAALPYRGFMVKPLNGKSIQDILDCRLMMEVFSTRQAVENFEKHPEIEREMLSALVEMQTLDPEDYVQTTHLEQIYHGSFVRLTENEHLIELYNNSFGVGFSFYVYAATNQPIKTPELAQKEHHEMYKCLKDKNPSELEHLMRTHLGRTLELYKSFVPPDVSK